MESYEKFITNPAKLEEVFQMIQKQKAPERFDQDFLEDLGIEEPNSILYVRLFKNLSLITEDEQPHPKYFHFIESEEQSKQLIAGQIRNNVYRKVFEMDDGAHLRNQKEIRALFHKLMAPGKSETLIRLAADTFLALVRYADWNSEGQQHHSKKTEESQVSKGMGSLDKATSAHEEFILELMNGVPNHQYAYENSSAVEEKVNEQNIRSDIGYNQVEAKEQNKLVIRALQRKAELLERLDRVTDAVEAYNNIINHADESSYPIESEKVLGAFYKKATLLDDLEYYEEALISYDKLIQRFAKSA